MWINMTTAFGLVFIQLRRAILSHLWSWLEITYSEKYVLISKNKNIWNIILIFKFPFLLLSTQFFINLSVYLSIRFIYWYISFALFIYWSIWYIFPLMQSILNSLSGKIQWNWLILSTPLQCHRTIYRLPKKCSFGFDLVSSVNHQNIHFRMHQIHSINPKRYHTYWFGETPYIKCLIPKWVS